MLKKMRPLMFALLLLAILIPASVFANTQTLIVSNDYSSMNITAPATDVLTKVDGAVAAKLDLTYTQDDKVATYYAGKVIPITASSSGILQVNATAISLTDEVDFHVYTDAACTNSLGYLDDLTNTGSSSTSQVALPSAGTYYLRVDSWYSSSYTFQNVLSMNISFYSNAGMALNSGRWYTLGQNDGDVYYKLKMPYKGYLTLTGGEETSFELTNSSKNVLKSYQSFDEDYNKKCTYRLSAGTYYFKPGRWAGEDDLYKIKYTTTKVDPTMKKGVYTTIYPGDSKEVTYLKIKPTVNGYIKVSVPTSSVYDTSGDIALCNSSKTKLTSEEWIYGSSSTSNTLYYGVKKGKTYYLKMTDFDGKAKIKYTQTAITEKSGKTKKKAVSVKAKKLVKGTVVAGEKQADWYKIKLTKNKKLSIYVNGKAQGRLKLTIYNAAGKKMTSNTIVSGNYCYDLESWSKYKKGTYYVKVERETAKSNGYYTLKWR